MQDICHDFTMGGSALTWPKKLSYTSFYTVIEVQSERIEKLGSFPEKCFKL